MPDALARSTASPPAIRFNAEYRPEGFALWPDDPEFSFQFIRALTASHEGGGTIGECLLAASRMSAGDHESWHREWYALGVRREKAATEALAGGHIETARVDSLRAANYYRSAEFFLEPDDPRRMTTFDRIEANSHRYLSLLEPAGEIVRIPYENGSHMDAYFLRAPGAPVQAPVIIGFGGLDEYKDELLHEFPKHAFPRGLSLLLVDLPGQGGTHRRQGIKNRHDSEVPIGRCIDYLIGRGDVDPQRIAVYGSSLGGYYAPRAACFDHRIRAVVSAGAIWDEELLVRRLLVPDPHNKLSMHMKWAFGRPTMEGVLEKSRDFRLEPVIGQIRCPYLITHGGADWLGLDVATQSHEHARRQGVDATLKIFTPEETGAAHCQADNRSLGHEFVCDWIADRLGIDERSLRHR